MKRLKALSCAALALLFALAAVCALAEAEEITARCSLFGKPKAELPALADGRYATSWLSLGGENAALTVAAPQGEAIGGVYLQFSEKPCAFDVQTRDADGVWRCAAACETAFQTGYAALAQAAEQVRIVPHERGGRLHLAEIHVFSQGETPAWVQRWEAPLEKADLLVLAGHPDDELLFMGGTIPYYAGERGLRVQVAYLVASTPYRRLELLDGLWLCGVRNYPDLGPFPDKYTLTLGEMYRQKGWREEKVLGYVAGLYRRYRPEVVVSHDTEGEYGHGAHRVAADAALRCAALAADAAYRDERTEGLEPWAIQKLYLHLYGQGELVMDWNAPLSAFGGRTALEMAKQAFACHISQQKTSYRVEDSGVHDCSRFGLAFSAVGDDVEKKDFFEHIE